MATFQKRSTNWRAIIRLMGVSSSATFSTKAEAQAWATQEEATILSGKRGGIPDKTFGQLLERYADEVSIAKKGERWEKLRIELTCRDAISKPPATATARVGAACLFAIETAMRAGEIAGLTWSNVRLDQRHCKTSGKTAAAKRDVPLSAEAIRIIQQMPNDFDTVFNLTTGQINALFRKAKGKSLVDGLHFHDLRHTAITRLAQKLDVLALARMVGHRDLKMLQIYYNKVLIA